MPLRHKEDNMAANHARLEFLHRMVRNLYFQGDHKTARKALERNGGFNYLSESTSLVQDDMAKNQLADLLFIWWTTTGNTTARNLAQNIWTNLLSKGIAEIHAAQMLGYITLQNPAASDEELRLRISQLCAACEQTTDAQRVKRMTTLAQQLGNIILWRCNQ